MDLRRHRRSTVLGRRHRRLLPATSAARAPPRLLFRLWRLARLLRLAGLRLGGFVHLRLLRRRAARWLFRLAFGGDRLLNLGGLADKRRVGGALEHPFDLHGDLLADELGGAGNRDVETVDLADARTGVVEADLHELDLELVALGHRRGRRELFAFALPEHDEVVEVHVVLATNEVEAAPRLLLELG